jgi:hypothetical protein
MVLKILIIIPSSGLEGLSFHKISGVWLRDASKENVTIG